MLRRWIKLVPVLLALLMIGMQIVAPTPTYANTTWYVSKSGNDTTGNGSSGAPWLTIDKAIRQNSSLASGDIVAIGDGTYTENSGSGYLSIAKNFSIAIPVTVIAQNGNAGNVTITGTSGNYDVVVGNAIGFTFQYLKFQQYANTGVKCIHLNGNATQGITFSHCTGTVLSNSGQVNYFCDISPTTGTTGITNITFDTCTINCDATFQTRGISILAVDGTTPLDSISIHDCTINCGCNPIVVSGATNVSIYRNVCNATYTAGGGYGCLLGYDGHDCVHTTSGNVYNNYFSTTGGHGLITGGITTTSTLKGNFVVGGNTTSAGQGLVVKSINNAIVTDNVVFDGLNSGLYLKGCTAATCQRNIIYVRYNTFAYSAGIRDDNNPDVNGTTYVSSGNTVSYNRFVIAAANGHAMYVAGSSGTDGTDVFDHNEYDMQGGGVTWGTVYGVTTSGTTLSGLRTAWASAPSGMRANDTNSALAGSLSTLSYAHSATGAYLYSVISNDAGWYWNGSSFMEPGSVPWGQVVSRLLESYVGSYNYSTPSVQMLASGLYTVRTYVTTTGVASATDTLLDTRALDWQGSSRASVQSVQTTANTINANAATAASQATTAATQATIAATQATSAASSSAALPSASQIAAVILATPSQKIATDASGNVALSTTTQNAIRDAIWAKVIDGTFNAQDVAVLQLASIAGRGANSWNTNTRTNTGTRYRQDGTTPAYAVGTTYITPVSPLPATSTSTAVTTPLH